ncbi:MAG TPA: aminodeoxychorismate lyase, partial [Candidatus Wunengus californicus]|uniref:aminodeoxychorismate lyase n=1 Tax=Candidatus Wunengus californicus TaxID=3367619 RepID=UPI004028064C
MSNRIFLNDKIVKDTEGLLSTLDRGFLYGDGLFETLRTYGKTPFRLEDHVARLSNSAQYFNIPFHYTSQQIRQIIEHLLTENNLKDAYIRMTLSRGLGFNGLIPTGTCAPTFVIHTKPLAAYPASLYKTGVLLITSHIRRSATCPISCHKTLNFLTNYLIKRKASEKGAHDALILNTDNHIAECAVSNIFVVEKNTVITPSLKANVLPGITRKIVLELCKENGIHASEELFGLERVFGASEVFITNALMEIMPVSKIDGYAVGKLVPGTITKLLHDKYKS